MDRVWAPPPPPPASCILTTLHGRQMYCCMDNVAGWGPVRVGCPLLTCVRCPHCLQTGSFGQCVRSISNGRMDNDNKSSFNATVISVLSPDLTL